MNDKLNRIDELITKVGRDVENTSNYRVHMREYLKYEKFGELVVPLTEILKLDIEAYESSRIGGAGNLSKPLYLAHYTSIETVYSILENCGKEGSYTSKENCLRLYGALSMNDPSEGNYLKNKLAEHYKWLKIAEGDTDDFICSFVSGNKYIGDQLKYWQSYGKDGLGCSIQLLPITKNDNVFHPVIYGNEGTEEIKKKFEYYFELGGLLYDKCSKKVRKWFSTQFWKGFDQIKFFYKHESYKYEHEYRLVKIQKEEEVKYHFKSEGPYLRRYILNEDLCANNILTSGCWVIVGPRVEDKKRLCQNLTDIYKKTGLDGLQITYSKTPYRKIW